MERGEILQYIRQGESILNNEAEFNDLCESAFQDADQDVNGEICLKEFMKSYSQVLERMKFPEPSEEQTQQKFDELDTDKSGKLNRQEYRVFVREVTQMIIDDLKKKLN